MTLLSEDIYNYNGNYDGNPPISDWIDAAEALEKELALLRRIVTGLVSSSGRLTASDSYELDYCWDLAEEYVNGPVDDD